jgi:cell volume regulation protein A
MQDIAPVIAVVGIIIFLAHLFTGIFNRTRIPDVLFLIILGICLGPVLGLVSPSQFGNLGPVFASITLIIILFECGTNLKLEVLRSALGNAIKLATLGFIITTAIVAGFAIWLADLELVPAFILGAIVGSTSEAIVIPLIKQLKMREESQTTLSIESSVTAVLSIVVAIALIEAYKLGDFQVITITANLLAAFFVAIAFGIIGALIWSVALSKIHSIKNTMFTTPAFVFVIFGIVEILGFNGAMAALAFGITIGNIEPIQFVIFKKRNDIQTVGLNGMEKVFFSEVAFLLTTFFFVYLGISLELISSWLLVLGLILTVMAFICRILVVKLSINRSASIRDASFMAVMIPKGLAAVVLASIPLQQGIPGGEIIKNLTYGMVLFSIIISSLLVFLLDKTPLSKYYGKIVSPFAPMTQRVTGLLNGSNHETSAQRDEVSSGEATIFDPDEGQRIPPV